MSEEVAWPVSLVLPQAVVHLFPDAGGKVRVRLGGQSLTGLRGGRGQQETEDFRALEPAKEGGMETGQERWRGGERGANRRGGHSWPLAKVQVGSRHGPLDSRYVWMEFACHRMCVTTECVCVHMCSMCT